MGDHEQSATGDQPTPAPAAGFVAPDVAAEFPGLRLQYVAIAHRPRPSPPSLVRRLRELSNRYRGANVVSMRTKPVPRAFRSFFRQIGLDPDVSRIPSEQAAVGRLLHGGFRSVDQISDACLVALIETGVPVWALDADVVDDGGLGIRTIADQEPVPLRDELAVAPGSLVVADRRSVHAVLFSEPAPGHGVGSRTGRVMLYAIAVDGVPEIHIDEALWCALDLLRAGRSWW
jgi:DNA/RNA-binding domain of Phe-tRNA-synthetase-like protein